MHIIQQAFGEDNCDLYADVLNCERDADKAALRKAYYRTALKYHPDKNPGDASAAANFHAVTAAYQILQDADLRAAYDESGVIPDEEPDDSNDDDDKNNHWKEYFDRIFGKVTVGDIEAFAAKYKCSDEEMRDVLKEYTARKGNLEKMLEFVMLSEPRDAQRWVEDYLRPAIDSKKVSSSFADTMEKTLKKLQKKVEKQDAEENEIMEDEEEEEVDDDETESEDEEEPPAAQRKRRAAEAAAAKKAKAKKSSQSPKKGKPTKAKQAKNSKTNDVTDLIAQIQNKRRGGGGAASMMANLGARYGVSMDDDDEDPLNDKDFDKIQSKLKGKKKK